jgi:hypothetical protein
MANPEHQLLSHIIRKNALEAAIKLGVCVEDFLSDEGRNTWNWLMLMRRDPRYAGAQPGENVMRERFPNFDFCDDESMTIEAYAALVRDNRLAIEAQSVARQLSVASANPVEAAAGAIERLRAVITAGAPAGAVVSAADLAAEPDDDDERHLLVPDLGIGPGAYTLLAAAGGTGKSTLAMALALAVASGERWLGRFDVRRGRVLHADGDMQGRGVTADGYRKLARGTGIALASLGDALVVNYRPPPLVVMDDRRPAANVAAWEALARGRDLLIVDSLAALVRGLISENAAEIRLPLDALNGISERTGCTILVLHHLAKPQNQGTGGRHMIRGSGAILESSGSAFMLAREGERVVLTHERTRGIGATTHEPIPISLHKLGEKSFALTAQGEAVGNRDVDACNRVLEALKAGPLAKEKIREIAKIKPDRSRAAIKVLEAERRIERDGRYRYKLATTPERVRGSRLRVVS